MQKAADLDDWLTGASLPDLVELLDLLSEEMRSRDLPSYATMLAVTASLLQQHYSGNRDGRGR